MNTLISLQLLSRIVIYLCIISATNTYHSQEADGGISFNIDNDKDIMDITKKESKNPNSPDNTIDLSQLGTDLYGEPDYNQTPNRLKEHEDKEGNPEELGGYLEGDILVPIQSMYFRNGLPDRSSRWPNAVVPFEVVGIAGLSLKNLHKAMEEYHKNTCIRFVPRTTQADYISFVSSSSGCWSGVGRLGGKQVVNLQVPSCLVKTGTAMHEIMHALGFMHEQSREERDSYVEIQFQNMDSPAYKNFKKAAHTVAFGVPYDYGSIMHYSPTAFSSNGRPTILARVPREQTKMGQRDAFSKYDIEKLNKMYECGSTAAEFERQPIVVTPPPETKWNEKVFRNAQKHISEPGKDNHGHSALEAVEPIKTFVTEPLKTAATSGQGTTTTTSTKHTVTTITNHTTSIITSNLITGQKVVEEPMTTITKQTTTTITETHVTTFGRPNATTSSQSAVQQEVPIIELPKQQTNQSGHAGPLSLSVPEQQLPNQINVGSHVASISEQQRQQHVPQNGIVQPLLSFSLASLVPPVHQQNVQQTHATQLGHLDSLVSNLTAEFKGQGPT